MGKGRGRLEGIYTEGARLKNGPPQPVASNKQTGENKYHRIRRGGQIHDEPRHVGNCNVIGMEKRSSHFVVLRKGDKGGVRVGLRLVPLSYYERYRRRRTLPMSFCTREEAVLLCLGFSIAEAELAEEYSSTELLPLTDPACERSIPGRGYTNSSNRSDIEGRTTGFLFQQDWQTSLRRSAALSSK